MNIGEFLGSHFTKVTPELSPNDGDGLQVSLKGELPVIHTLRGALKQVIWLHVHGGMETQKMQELLREIEKNEFGLPQGGPIDISLKPCSCREHYYLWYLGEQVASIWSHRHLLEIVKQILDLGYASRDQLSDFLTNCIKDEEGVGALPNGLHDCERQVQKEKAALFSAAACICPEQAKNDRRAMGQGIQPRGSQPQPAHEGWVPFME